jgi:hypothetical protein
MLSIFNKVKTKGFCMFLCSFLFAAEDPSVNPQEEERVPVQQGFKIFECTRAVRNFFSERCPTHCFVAFTENGKKLGSRGFFADAGSIEEPDMSEGFVKCRAVRTFPIDQKDAAIAEWGKVVTVYDRYTPEMYKLMHTNCCSVATEAIRQITQPDETLDVERANCYVGTRIKSKSTE